MKTLDDVKIDSRGRAALGQMVKPRERYAVEKPDEGVIVMRRMLVTNGAGSTVRLERRQGRTLLVSSRQHTQDDVKRVMEVFP